MSDMLRSLEIQGFKSFADKIVLKFPTRITAIVGPNGSGKSNVADAFRWVLGEQSSKNIRIANAADVIFNGTPQRAQAGFASAALTFDNSRKIFPVDFSEVTLARKVYRDGVSEYAVNKKQMRLKDLTQILASAKLGVKGMGIINQGAGDVFLRASPIERREMIEEMVGLKEYRLKKEDAERRMKATSENIAKVQNILLELEPNLRLLRRQVAKWQSRAEKEHELHELSISYFSHKIWDLEHSFSHIQLSDKDADALQKDVDVLRKEIAELQGTFAELEYEDPSKRIERERTRKEIAELERKKSDLLGIIGRLEGQSEVYRSLAKTQAGFDASQAQQQFEKVLTSLRFIVSLDAVSIMREKIQNVISGLESFLSSHQHRLKDKNEQLQSCTQQLAEAQTELQNVLSALDKFSSELAKFNQAQTEQSKRFKDAVKAMEAHRDQLREKETALEHIRFNRERKKLYEDDIRLKMQEAGFAWDEFVVAHRDDINHAEAHPIVVADVEMRIIRLRRDLAVMGEIDQEVVASCDEASRRFEFLTHEKQDLASALEDLQTLNQSLEEKITAGFEQSLRAIDTEFNRCFQLIFAGGKASVKTVRVGINQTEGEMEEMEKEGGAVGDEREGMKNEKGKKKEQGELGIEFSVHLPRKKIKSLEALSGGERSLTAIALLFAIIISAKPPLLVLDEIDAALDEANSCTFARLLRDIAHDVQCIIITHNRAVMESADVLYGVTMQDGLSKIFSLQFTQAQEFVGQDRVAEVQ
ncbi:MAG: hypothetical protein COV41_02785 [Candidatus Brennerbacteria bacterium CG11_big_fil_rev_8_21_14_0_20_43_10]|uniref:AAA+ ATPase domain-containing protein n=2 Tax=Candidatus Brenneribacteriota TaxID=1817902 RepID=A0A2M8C1K7_9BACT|nr:MAG: hypothetical protein COV41_02785 [Candidatus Brennerbacteria bacterium CG11_big_fil_rev_8_21_14_0_20_43_10]PJB49996.1 MAG: hypothetical protein CO102_02305 [Candidatus Brennerbacteria bacterium CG_4_9_14_3_um_filter_43_9]